MITGKIAPGGFISGPPLAAKPSAAQPGYRFSGLRASVKG
jgi:hypothetical protein